MLKTFLKVLLLTCSFYSSAELSIKIIDKQNRPLSNIVVEIESSAKDSEQSFAASDATMTQIDQQFVPHILAIRKGDMVNFPDTDTVQHHVYSFSEARTFEIAIYQQDVTRQIAFDKPGIVEIGCNIHDWMLGYIYVANSALFQQTSNDGTATFAKLPNSTIKFSIWHPRLKAQDLKQTFTVEPSQLTQTFVVKLKQDLLPSFSDFDNIHGVADYD